MLLVVIEETRYRGRVNIIDANKHLALSSDRNKECRQDTDEKRGSGVVTIGKRSISLGVIEGTRRRDKHLALVTETNT